jgi:peptidyl-prolyl cis-trans isomerase SurA
MKAFSALAVLLAAGFTARAELADGISAIVHDAIITHQQIENYSMAGAEQLQRQFYNQPEKLDQELLKLQQDNMERLVQDRLILHEFETSGYTNNLPESIIDQELEESIRKKFSDNRITFTKTLQAEGLTYEQYRKQFRENLIIEAMQYKNVFGEIIISPHKVEAYYLQHTNDFMVEDQVKLRMIVLSKSADDNGQSRRLADEIESKLKEGASFGEMASVYSQGSQRNEGAWFENSKLRKELAEAAKPLKPGQRSGIIETPEAVYLMLVEDKRAAYVRPLAEVRDEIEGALLKEEHNRLQKQWIDRLRRKTYVRYF